MESVAVLPAQTVSEARLEARLVLVGVLELFAAGCRLPLRKMNCNVYTIFSSLFLSMSGS